MATQPSPHGTGVNVSALGKRTIHLIETRQVTVDIAAAASAVWVADGYYRIVAVNGHCNVIGGSTVFTDVDLDVHKKRGSGSYATVLAAVIGVVDSSAIVLTQAGTVGGLSTTESDLIVKPGDILALVIDITGGLSPTGNGIGAYVELEHMGGDVSSI